MENKQKKDNEVTLLVDAYTLNNTVNCIYDIATKALGHAPQKLNMISFSIFTSVLAKLPECDKEAKTMINIIFDENITKLDNCYPSNFENELSGVSTQCDMGRFIFNSYQTGGITNCDDMLLKVLDTFIADESTNKIGIVYNFRIDKEIQDKINWAKKNRPDLSITPVILGYRHNVINIFDIITASFQFTKEEMDAIEKYAMRR